MIDPVCGMTVEPASAAAKLDHEGKTYYFCSKHCAHAFQQEPARYLSGAINSMARDQDARAAVAL